MNPAQRSGARMLGFIGLGGMGSRMATRLLNAGYELGVYNRTADKSRALADLGARVYRSPTDLAQEANPVLSMLADDAAVEQVLLAPSGVVSALRAGATIVDLSSVHPETSQRIASAARLRDIEALDAPVSGSLPQAEDGSLVMFEQARGVEEDFSAVIRTMHELARPVLSEARLTSP